MIQTQTNIKRLNNIGSDHKLYNDFNKFACLLKESLDPSNNLENQIKSITEIYNIINENPKKYNEWPSFLATLYNKSIELNEKIIQHMNIIYNPKVSRKVAGKACLELLTAKFNIEENLIQLKKETPHKLDMNNIQIIKAFKNIIIDDEEIQF